MTGEHPWAGAGKLVRVLLTLTAGNRMGGGAGPAANIIVLTTLGSLIVASIGAAWLRGMSLK